MKVDVVSLASEFPNDNPALHCGVIWVCFEPTGPARAERVHPPDAPRIGETQPGHLEAEVALEPNGIEAQRDSLAPPEDEDADAGPIVVEELEPLEASFEGVDTIVEVATDLAPSADVTSEETPEDTSIEIAAVPEEILSVEEGSSGDVVLAEPVEIPVPAASEIVLVGERVHAEAVFEEVVSTSVPAHDSSALPPASDDPFTILVCTLADVAIGAGSPHVASLLPGLLFDGRLPEPLDAEIAEALRAAGIMAGSEVSASFVYVTAAWRAILRGTSDDFDACGTSMLDEWASDLLARLLAVPGKAPSLRQELRSRGVAAFGLAA